MKKRFIFFNSASGSYSAGEAERIVKLLEKSGLDVTAILPASEAEAAAKVRSLSLQYEKPLLIAAGGDGTLNALINGMPEEGALLGYIPMGTANVASFELGIKSVEDAVSRISRGITKPLNVAVVSSRGVSRRFFLMAGIGFDGAVVEGIRGHEKQRYGKGAYLLSALRAAAAYDKRPLKVECCGESVITHSVIITNAVHYGGKFKVSAGSSIHERSLEVIPIDSFSVRSILSLSIRMLLTGKIQNKGSMILREGEITVSGDKACQIDGDSFARGDFAVSLEPQSAEIIV